MLVLLSIFECEWTIEVVHYSSAELHTCYNHMIESKKMALNWPLNFLANVNNKSMYNQ